MFVGASKGMGTAWPAESVGSVFEEASGVGDLFVDRATVDVAGMPSPTRNGSGYECVEEESVVCDNTSALIKCVIDGRAVVTCGSSVVKEQV